ncbi:MAG: hypothetical protein M3364_02035 [Actinomycetota bacterium]|nr:hypothetical protein [Actinomycetota bacterium]
MDVVIRLDRIEPPAGMVLLPSDANAASPDPLPFVGWLGLLRVLAEVVRAATEPAEDE